MIENELDQALERAAEAAVSRADALKRGESFARGGGGPERVWQVPENAKIQLDAVEQGHLLAGATLTHWSHDG